MTSSVSLDSLVRRVARSAPTPLGQLAGAVATAAELSALSDDLVDHYVERARGRGCSWAEIGEVLGVSRQAAQQRFPAVGAGPALACKQDQLPLTPRARKALRQARRQARRTGSAMASGEVSSDHLVLGLLRDPQSLAAEVLSSHGVAYDALEKALEQRAPQPARRRPADPSAPLERAATAARELGHEQVGTEHLLLGLVAAPGPVRDALRSLGVDEEGVREAVRRLLEGEQVSLRRGRLSVRSTR